MNKQLKIAVDWDGNLARTSDAICELINFRTNSNHTYKEINRWSYWDDIGKGKDFWDAYNYLDENGRLHIKPYDKHVFWALANIKRMFGGFDIVTANNEEAARHIKDWMFWYGKISRPNIICIGRKTAAEKLELDYQIYIDDNPGLAEEAKNYPNKYILLANAPWNKHIKDSFNVKRFESWKEIPNLIKTCLK